MDLILFIMGPLIPQNIISGDLNFFFAFMIGIAFGFILEQAGFSSSRKLAGVFYGYDFVVLKVFFTAGVTAAIGVFFFQYFGLIDINFVFVNPLFTWSAIIGGVIMGFGFIMGGFCPGTGFAAAVIGKIDAIIFIVGIFIGVFLFGVFFDFFEPIYNANPLGRAFVFDSLGMSQKWFLFILTAVAVIAFAVTQEIQDSSTKFKELLNTQKLSIKWPLVFLMLIVTIALFLPTKRTSYFKEVSAKDMIEKISSDQRNITVQQLAYSIIHNTSDFYLIDVRSQADYIDFHLPGAINIPLENIVDNRFRNNLHMKNKRTVFYSNGSSDAEMAWFFATRAGRGEFFVLEGGLNNFIDVIFSEIPDYPTNDIIELNDRRFRENARKFFLEGEIYNLKPSDSEIPDVNPIAVKPASGGC